MFWERKQSSKSCFVPKISWSSKKKDSYFYVFFSDSYFFNAIIISSKFTDGRKIKLDIACNGTSIHLNESSKYLGLIIDNKLLFKKQINEIESKTARSVSILSYANFTTHYSTGCFFVG